jgi:hypothetical protein
LILYFIFLEILSQGTSQKKKKPVVATSRSPHGRTSARLASSPVNTALHGAAAVVCMFGSLAHVLMRTMLLLPHRRLFRLVKVVLIQQWLLCIALKSCVLALSAKNSLVLREKDFHIPGDRTPDWSRRSTTELDHLRHL